MSLTFSTKKIGMNAIMGTRYINPKKLRNDLGRTRKEVGARINVSQSTIAGWENRRRIPNIIDVWKLAGALGIVQQNIGKLAAYWALVDD